MRQRQRLKLKIHSRFFYCRQGCSFANFRFSRQFTATATDDVGYRYRPGNQVPCHAVGRCGIEADAGEKFPGCTLCHNADIFDQHRNMPQRVQTVAMRLMRLYTDFCAGYAKFMALKCMGKDAEAKEEAIAFLDDFGKYELAMEHYYDHFMARNAINAIINTKSDFDQ